MEINRKFALKFSEEYMTAPTKTLAQRLKIKVDEAIAKAGDGNETILSYTFPFDAVDLLPTLTHPADKDVTRIYWEQPSRKMAMAGLGQAFSLDFHSPEELDTANQTLCHMLDRHVSVSEKELPGPMFFGGHAFNLADTSDDTWKNFPRGRFVLSECLAVKNAQGSYLVISRMVKKDDQPRHVVEEFTRTCIHYTNRLPVTLPPIRYVPVDKFRDIPDREQYQRIILSVLKKIRPGKVEKVVISRSHHVKVGKSFRVISAIQVLRNAYHECTSFLFSFPGEGVFFGSTPERLIKKQGNRVKTEALAGTIGRGRNMEEDRLLMEILIDSHKEQEEHRFVVDQILRKLKPLLSELNMMDHPGIMKLKNVQHLRTEISGTLNNGKNIIALAQRLHPTPAVAGTPTDRAMEIIKQYEQHDRGWYSGPVGWMDRNGDGEFCVALRSALVKDDEAHVFAGGGIMAESVPDKEWNETELKLQPIISALSGGQI